METGNIKDFIFKFDHMGSEELTDTEELVIVQNLMQQEDQSEHCSLIVGVVVAS